MIVPWSMQIQPLRVVVCFAPSTYSMDVTVLDENNTTLEFKNYSQKNIEWLLYKGKNSLNVIMTLLSLTRKNDEDNEQGWCLCN